MQTMTVTEVRARMREVLEYVKEGQEVELSQNGQVIAVIVHPSKLHTRVRTPNTLAADALLENLKRVKAEQVGTNRRELKPVMSQKRGKNLETNIRIQRNGTPE